MEITKAREFFENDIFATKTCGIIIEETGDNYAKCSMKIEKKHKNAMDRVMGGAIFALADFAFAVASNTDDVFTVSTVNNISFVSAAKSDVLIGEAKLVKDGRTVCFYNIEVRDDLGNLVANMNASGTHLQKK